MEKKKLLIIAQELAPYTEGTIPSDIVNQLALYANAHAYEIRILMPRYGMVNERRHRLHEVVRLSGMNIIVNDDDYPLIIKVASLPGSRMQVYFLDNDDFFKRKELFEDQYGHPFEDNPDRMVFFCKGAIETARKFGWSPDIIHCHGWMTSLIPAYIRTVYKNEPVFQQSKLIYSNYQDEIENYFTDNFVEKASINNLVASDLDGYFEDGKVKLHLGAAKYADGIIITAENADDALMEKYESLEKPLLDARETPTAYSAYLELYANTMEAVAQKS
jgi:starch synthase